MITTEATDLLVIGAGPAGLAAAEVVAAAGHRVIVVDREQEPGGVPRHCLHTGFGLRDLHRVCSGPGYAGQRVQRATSAGARILPGFTATDWVGPTSVMATSSRGRTRLQAQAVLLATGCRERPRAARMIPGDRPAGVFTTGALQQLVHLAGHRAGRRAVVVGAEHIAFSAVHTLTGSGTRVAAVLTDSAGLETFQLLRAGTAGIHRVPVLYRHRIQAIHGRGRVTGLTVCDTATQQTRRIECDTVVFTGDWVPDYELARAAGLEMDPGTRGPVVDTSGASSTPGVYVAGNLLHPAEPADIAALGGRHAARAILARLRSAGSSPEGPPSVRLHVERPLAWIAPQRLDPGRPPARGRFVLRAAERSGAGRLVVSQDDRVLHEERIRRLVPNRSLALSASWASDLPGTGAVTIGYAPRGEGTDRDHPGGGEAAATVR